MRQACYRRRHYSEQFRRIALSLFSVCAVVHRPALILNLPDQILRNGQNNGEDRSPYVSALNSDRANTGVPAVTALRPAALRLTIL